MDKFNAAWTTFTGSFTSLWATSKVATAIVFVTGLVVGHIL